MQSPPADELAAVLGDPDKPLAQRMRAVFFLTSLKGPVAVEALGKGLKDKAEGALLRHELAYCLGQMQDATALPVLEAVLRDVEDDPIVRHECGEAIGAIGKPDYLAVLEEFSTDARPEVSETCKLAAERVRWVLSGRDKEEKTDENPYYSVDPAPATAESTTDEELQSRLTNTELPLFERYRAMFSLRNKQTESAVLVGCLLRTGATTPHQLRNQALTAGLESPDSALFRHEVAYVLGQLQHPASTDALAKSLANVEEHEMVRHEAAEALGAIGTEEAVALLKRFAKDPSRVVRESCVVALDAVDYWSGLASEADTEAAGEGVAAGAEEEAATAASGAGGAGAGAGDDPTAVATESA